MTRHSLCIALVCAAACRTATSSLATSNGSAASTAPNAIELANPAGPAEPARAPIWKSTEPVRIRLSEFSRTNVLELQLGAHEALRVERRGDRVELVQSERRGERSELVRGGPQAFLRIAARDAEFGIQLGDHRFHGEFEIRAEKSDKQTGLQVDDLIDLEEYVECVVAAETPIWSAQDAELEAQAITSRSYAICALSQRATKSKDPHLVDDTRDQVYHGVWNATRTAAAKRVAERVHSAVLRTRGRVLFEGERVVDARFSASCGGTTANASEVAPEANFACLRSVACEPCRDDADPKLAKSEGAASEQRWTWNGGPKALANLARTLGVGDRLESWRATKKDESGRWLEVEVTGDRTSRTLDFDALRTALEANALKSNWITGVAPSEGRPIEGSMRVEGRGRGHGVGLCQRGARGYAERGWTCAMILEHYFPGARVAPLAE